MKPNKPAGGGLTQPMKESCRVVTEQSSFYIAFTEKSLCTRCGTCVGVCPTDALSIDDFCYPKIDQTVCTKCGLCGKVCAGGKLNFAHLSETTFGHKDAAADFDGQFLQSYIGYATDEKLRSGGASGGVVSALLWSMLKEGEIEGCLVTRMSPDNPCRGEPFIARCYNDIVESQQSKYIIIPVNSLLAKLRSLKGIYAVVALPCQIHGLRLIQREIPALFEKIHVIIGLHCATTLEPNVTEEMLLARSLDPARVAKFSFREGPWPGRFLATMADGEEKELHKSNFKDGAINYLTYLYSPLRCQTCIDGSAEFADLSVADAWSRNPHGGYQFQGHSRCIVRTDRGMNVVMRAVEAGEVLLEDVTHESIGRTHQNHAKKKKVRAPLRIARFHRKGLSVPWYDRGEPKSCALDQLQEILDTLIMQLGQKKSLRSALWKFLVSDFGVPLIRLRQFLKRYRFKPM